MKNAVCVQRPLWVRVHMCEYQCAHCVRVGVCVRVFECALFVCCCAVWGCDCLCGCVRASDCVCWLFQRRVNAVPNLMFPLPAPFSIVSKLSPAMSPSCHLPKHVRQNCNT